MNQAYSTDDYLEHHGVKGMKWGVRKRPKPTSGRRRGSSKRASKARAVLGQGVRTVGRKTKTGIKALSSYAAIRVTELNKRHQEKRAQKKERKQRIKNRELLRRNKLKGMSDDELTATINRIKKEKEYIELTKTRGERVKSAIGAQLGSVATGLLGQAGKTVLDSFIESKKRSSELASLAETEAKLATDYKTVTASEIQILMQRHENLGKYVKAGGKVGGDIVIKPPANQVKAKPKN